jgi:hypothetical protein
MMNPDKIYGNQSIDGIYIDLLLDHEDMAPTFMVNKLIHKVIGGEAEQ